MYLNIYNAVEFNNSIYIDEMYILYIEYYLCAILNIITSILTIYIKYINLYTTDNLLQGN